MITFRDRVLQSSPDWLRGYWGERFVGVTFGLVADMVAHVGTMAVRMGWIADPEVPADALVWHGLDRNSPRYPTESDPAYQTRLAASWYRWQVAGTDGGMALEFSLAGVPLSGIAIAPISDPDWSRYYLTFASDHGITLTPGWVWGSGPVWGSGWRWGVSDPNEVIQTVTGILDRQNPVRWRCVELDFDGVVLPLE